MACKVFVRGVRRNGKSLLTVMRSNSKLRLLNSLLAADSPFANDVFADASEGIEFAIKSGCADIALEPFAKKILRLYDPDAHLEFLDFENSHFDPLFAFVAVSDCAKRLAGYGRAVLIVSGLERAGISPNARMTSKRKSEYAENMDVLESYLTRFEFENVEIIFI